ncbi:MAG: hypothetical protein IJF76_00375 [Clostridia bacterium]|nr:hypothetical protein [Clostridia bacterium]
MINLYEARELENAQKKLNIYNWIIGVIVFVWLALNVLFFILKQSLEWGESDLLYRALAILSTCVCACVVFFIIALPRRMCKGYKRVYEMVLHGDPKPVESIFFGQDNELTQRYGVDFYELLFYDGVNQKGREVVSRVVVDAEKDISDVEIGDKVRFCTCGTVLASYEIVEKGAMKQEDIDVIFKRMEEHIGMDVVLYGENKKKGRLRR